MNVTVFMLMATYVMVFSQDQPTLPRVSCPIGARLDQSACPAADSIPAEHCISNTMRVERFKFMVYSELM